MNMKIKRFAAAILTLALLVMVFPAQMMVSYAATGKITFSDPTVTVGDQPSIPTNRNLSLRLPMPIKPLALPPGELARSA